MRTLLVLPLQKELDGFLQGCLQHGQQAAPSRVGRLPVVLLPALGLTLACGGLGKTQFGVQTQHLLDSGGPWDLAICAGAAGGLHNDLAIGDVVVATETAEHDIHNKFGPPLLPRFPGDGTTVEQLRTVGQQTSSFGVHLGVVASGDEDVVDVERRTILQQRTSALAVAWEGAGGARACRFSATPYVEIRGITDAANHTAPGDFTQNLALAMGNVAALVLAWLNSDS